MFRSNIQLLGQKRIQDHCLSCIRVKVILKFTIEINTVQRTVPTV